MSLRRKLGTFIITMCFVFAAQRAESQVPLEDGASYLVKGSGRGLKVTVLLKVVETVDTLPPFGPVFEAVGTLILKNKTSGGKVELKFNIDLDDQGKGDGKAKGRTRDGALVRTKMKIERITDDTIEIVLPTATRAGALRFTGEREALPNIAGVWSFVNDPAAPMTIVRKGKSNKYTGRYSGTGVHSSLKGTLIGTVVREGDVAGWTGVFTLREPPVVVTGEFNCILEEDETPKILGCAYSGGSSAQFLLAAQQ